MTQAPSTDSGWAASNPENPLISLIVPVYNEEEAIPRFRDRLIGACHSWPFQTKVLFVDDGSSDNTLHHLRTLASEHEFIEFLSFSRNFGKETALSAGIDHASGDAVILMDVDLQHPLEYVPQFVQAWREDGYDMVHGVRNTDNGESALKRLSSRLYYRLFNALSNASIPESAGDFRLLDRRVIEVIKTLPERNRFMKGLYGWVGFRSKAIPYEQPVRNDGTSRFNYWKLWNFALDGLVSFSTWPLRVWSYIGAFVALCSFLYASVIVLKTMLWGADVSGYASIITAVLFLGGMQLLSIGILGEYVGRLFIEAKQRPLYVISESSMAAHD